MVKVVLFFSTLLLVFIAWMNLTSGHFQPDCLCGVSYTTKEEVNNCKKIVFIACPTTESYDPVNKFLLSLSNLDIYK